MIQRQNRCIFTISCCIQRGVLKICECTDDTKRCKLVHRKCIFSLTINLTNHYSRGQCYTQLLYKNFLDFLLF